MKIGIKTLGCKSNRYESDKVFDDLKSEHEVFELNEGASSFFEGRSGETDLFIVNTCTVTHVADRKSRQAIRSFKKRNPGCKVVVFGCGVNVSREKYEKMEEVDLLADDSEQVVKFAKEIAGEMERCSYEGTGDAFDNGFRKRALIKIQDGCDSYCSYCIIPTARGPEYSFPSVQILKEAKAKEAAGFSEVVLTGINIGEWKEDGKDLADLFQMLIEGTEKLRFRVSSIEPKNFSEKFFELFKTGRFCPHIHMSLQSGSDSVLTRMRRHYLTDVFEDVCKRFREVVPDIGLTTDVIVGFPGETEEEFMETYRFIERIGFLKLHVFPFSRRAKTVAYHMKDQVDEQIKKERCRKLRELSDRLGREFKARWLGEEYDVLIEGAEDGILKGFTENYIGVRFKGDSSLLHRVRKIRLQELLEDGNVLAELI